MGDSMIDYLTFSGLLLKILFFQHIEVSISAIIS